MVVIRECYTAVYIVNHTPFILPQINTQYHQQKVTKSLFLDVESL